MTIVSHCDSCAVFDAMRQIERDEPRLVYDITSQLRRQGWIRLVKADTVETIPARRDAMLAENPLLDAISARWDPDLRSYAR